MDDQTQPRLYIESETIQEILLKCSQGFWTLLSSEVLLLEASNNKNEENKQKTLALINAYSSEMLVLTDETVLRAKDFQQHGIKNFDSLHLATAEHAGVDVLLSVDDRFIKGAKRSDAKVRVINPTEWVREVYSYE